VVVVLLLLLLLLTTNCRGVNHTKESSTDAMHDAA
jgi:hypothetical protein